MSIRKTRKWQKKLYYAVYEKGNLAIGTLRDSNLEALAEIKKATISDRTSR
jgi:hypothetical protein